MNVIYIIDKLGWKINHHNVKVRVQTLLKIPMFTDYELPRPCFSRLELFEVDILIGCKSVRLSVIKSLQCIDRKFYCTSQMLQQTQAGRGI